MEDLTEVNAWEGAPCVGLQEAPCGWSVQGKQRLAKEGAGLGGHQEYDPKGLLPSQQV